MVRRPHTLIPVMACVLAACTPTLDWREARPDGSGLTAMFPCKPGGHARKVALAGAAVEMSLFACTAGGATFAVGFADVGDPLRVEPALAELAAAAAGNVGAQGTQAIAPLRIVGATPNPQAGRRTFSGQLVDGQRVQEQVAVFAHGTRVFQATVVGASLDAEAIDIFFGALRLPS